MLRPRKLLTPSQMQRVDRVVAAVHARGPVRIIPVVVASSGSYSRAEDLFGLCTGSLAMAVFYLIFFPNPLRPDAEWSPGFSTVVAILSLLGTLIIGFVVGTLLAAHVPGLRRLFLGRKKMVRTVRSRARAVYHDSYVKYDEEDRPNIAVLFVSLFERHVEIVACEKFESHFNRADLKPIWTEILTGLSAGQFCRGLIRAVVRAAHLLGPMCQEPPDEPKPVPPQLVILD